MPLNILRHKSYHVYNANNIEKVQRDEENARKQEQLSQQQQLKSERAARTAFLRSHQVSPDKISPNKVPSVPVASASSDIQARQSHRSSDQAYIDSDRTNHHKNDPDLSDMGTKLNSFSEPWYAKSPRNKAVSQPVSEAKHRRQERAKNRLDPLAMINEAVKLTSEYEQRASRTSRSGRSKRPRHQK